MNIALSRLMYKWLEDYLGISKLKGEIDHLQSKLVLRESEINELKRKNEAQRQTLRSFSRNEEYQNALKRADNAEKLLAQLTETKRSMELLTAENGKWKKKYQRLKNKR
jgi:hypothetical protein